MHNVIKLDGFANDPPGIEDFLLTMIGPTIGQGDETAGQMHRAPESHAPEQASGEIHATVHVGDDKGKENDGRDVDFEKLPVLLGHRCADGRDQIEGHDEDDRCWHTGFPH